MEAVYSVMDTLLPLEAFRFSFMKNGSPTSPWRQWRGSYCGSGTIPMLKSVCIAPLYAW